MILVAGACSSVPEVTFGSGAGTDSSSSSSGNASSSGTPADGPRDVVPDCTANRPELCDDGIDNDCNGKIDCADEACRPVSECVDPAPAGWTLISFSDATRPPCATGYEAPVDLKVVDGTGQGNCTCDCNPTVAGEACTNGNFAVVIDTSNACGAAPVNAKHSTSCSQLANNIVVPVNNGFGEAAPPPGPSACDATTTVAASPVSLGKSCNVAPGTRLGKGCSTPAQQCAPKATGFRLCITKPGMDACPAPYTSRRTAGTEAVDTRACNACTCEPKGCSGSIELFSEVDCTVGGNKRSTGAIDSTCGAVNGNFTAIRYKSTLSAPQNGCGVQGTFTNAMTGNIAWTEQRTVCCKP